MYGCASKPPTALEQRWFDITTNRTPVLTVQTNVIPVTLYETNTVTVTNTVGTVEIHTNIVSVPSFETNVVTVTRTNESYVMTPGAGAREIAATGGAVGNIFGAGGLVSTGIMSLFTIWGWVRSKKNYVTAANTAQIVETIREFVKALPNGTAYDAALVQWMQQHQADAGVLNQVLSLLQREVSNPDARVAAQQIQQLIAGLQTPKVAP